MAKKNIIIIFIIIIGIIFLQWIIPAFTIKNPVNKNVFPHLEQNVTSNWHKELANILTNIDKRHYNCLKNESCAVDETVIQKNISQIKMAINGDFTQLVLWDDLYETDDILWYLVAAKNYYLKKSETNTAEKINEISINFSQIVLDEKNIFDAFFQRNVVTYLKSLKNQNNYYALFNENEREKIYERNIFLQYQFMINIIWKENIFWKYSVEDMVDYTRNYYYTVWILEGDFDVTFYPTVWNYQSTQSLKNHYNQNNNFQMEKDHFIVE